MKPFVAFASSAFLLVSSSTLAQTTPAASTPQAQEAAPAVDPARLAIATRITEKLVPPGSIKDKMLVSMMKMMDSMSSQMGAVPMLALAGIKGNSKEAIAKLPEANIKQAMAIMDPAYEERSKLRNRAAFSAMSDVLSGMEPDIKAAQSQAYARRFTEQQLTEIDAFYSTPTGTSYAAQLMSIAEDPAILNVMQAMMPKMMQAMPDIMKKAQAADSKLPKVRSFAALTPAERAKIRRLLGIKSKK